MLTIGSILVLALSGLSQASDKPEVKYDKFKDRTHISIHLKELPGEEGYSNITLAAGYEGKDPKTFDGSEGILLGFYRSVELTGVSSISFGSRGRQAGADRLDPGSLE